MHKHVHSFRFCVLEFRRHTLKQIARVQNPAQAGSRADALAEAVEELGHLEEYLRTVKPPKEDAIALSVRIVMADSTAQAPLRITVLFVLSSRLP